MKPQFRKAYQVVEERDIAGWVNCFTDDGTFTDELVGVTYRGPKELGAPSRFTRVHSLTCIATCTHSTSPETRSLGVGLMSYAAARPARAGATLAPISSVARIRLVCGSDVTFI